MLRVEFGGIFEPVGEGDWYARQTKRRTYDN